MWNVGVKLLYWYHTLEWNLSGFVKPDDHLQCATVKDVAEIILCGWFSQLV